MAEALEAGRPLCSTLPPFAREGGEAVSAHAAAAAGSGQQAAGEAAGEGWWARVDSHLTALSSCEDILSVPLAPAADPMDVDATTSTVDYNVDSTVRYTWLSLKELTAARHALNATHSLRRGFVVKEIGPPLPPSSAPFAATGGGGGGGTAGGKIIQKTPVELAMHLLLLHARASSLTARFSLAARKQSVCSLLTRYIHSLLKKNSFNVLRRAACP
ncbi:hypothetical protein T492DRAFT_1117252 [Pavlovales sp. CCMP2436]|nr:hypothetical protein T492DRAFT_1117252 [Pavlovales sp. CCMP2436]